MAAATGGGRDVTASSTPTLTAERPSARVLRNLQVALRTTFDAGLPVAKLTVLVDLINKALEDVAGLDESIEALEREVEGKKAEKEELRERLAAERQDREKE
ncbi:hypothetical protein JCM11251_003583 [Rhodosporidiobolus azoricus]